MAFVAASALAYAGYGAVDVALPSGLSVGNTLFACVEVEGGGATVTMPSGWDEVSVSGTPVAVTTNVTLRVYRRERQAGDSNVITVSASSISQAVAIFAFTAATAVTAWQGASTGFSNQPPSVSVTATANQWLLYFSGMGTQGRTLTPPSGMTQPTAVSSGGSSGDSFVSIGGAYQGPVSAGSAARQGSWDGGSPTGAILLAFSEAPGDSGTNATVTLRGAGSVSGTGAVIGAASASVRGAGNASTAATVRASASAGTTGSGRAQVAAAALVSAAATAFGKGETQSNAQSLAGSSAALIGSGRVEATGSIVAGASAETSGSGIVLAAGAAIAAAVGAAYGTGSTSVSAAALIAAAGSVTGKGHGSSNASVATPGSSNATLDVTGQGGATGEMAAPIQASGSVLGEAAIASSGIVALTSTAAAFGSGQSTAALSLSVQSTANVRGSGQAEFAAAVINPGTRIAAISVNGAGTVQGAAALLIYANTSVESSGRVDAISQTWCSASINVWSSGSAQGLISVSRSITGLVAGAGQLGASTGVLIATELQVFGAGFAIGAAADAYVSPFQLGVDRRWTLASAGTCWTVPMNEHRYTWTVPPDSRLWTT